MQNVGRPFSYGGRFSKKEIIRRPENMRSLQPGGAWQGIGGQCPPTVNYLRSQYYYHISESKGGVKKPLLSPSPLPPG